MELEQLKQYIKIEEAFYVLIWNYYPEKPSIPAFSGLLLEE